MKTTKENIRDTDSNVLYDPEPPQTATVDVSVHGIQSYSIKAQELKSDEPVSKPPIAENLAQAASSPAGRLSDQYEECLASLKLDTPESRQNQVRSAFLHTCSWLLNLNEFDKWYYPTAKNENKILWIKGKPGSGKSVLMKALCQHVQRERTGIAANDLYGEAVATFFFKGRHQKYYETRPASLYRNLLYQLFKQDPYLRQRLLSEFEVKSENGEKWRDSELQNVFEDVYLRGNAEIPLKHVYIFVDGVDECYDISINSVVNFLTNLAAKTNFSICFSSRHYPDMNLPNCVEIIVEKHNSADILHHIRSSLSRSFPDRDSVIQKVGEKAAGVFLWAEIIVDRLNSKMANGEPKKKILKFLDDVPSKIECLYENLLQDIKAEDTEAALNIFQWVLLASEPLTLGELRYALAFTGTGRFFNTVVYNGYQDPEKSLMFRSMKRDVPRSLLEWEHSQEYIENSEQLSKWLKAHSRGLVQVHHRAEGSSMRQNPDEQIVQLIHETFRTFFLTEAGFKILNPSIPRYSGYVSIHHQNLLSACVNLINIRELSEMKSEYQHSPLPCDDEIDCQRENWNRIRGPPESKNWDRPAFSSILDYAITYLFYHDLKIEENRLQVDDMIRILSVDDGQVWRRWKSLSEERGLNFSWLIESDCHYKSKLTMIQDRLDKRFQLPKAGALAKYADTGADDFF